MSPRRERFSPPRDRRYDDDRRGGADRRKRSFEQQLYCHVVNMPLPLNYRDVRKFFAGSEIPREGLKLINDRDGQRVGEAYIMFATEAHADQALGMNGWMLRGRHVMVERCSMEAFERAIDSYIPPGGAGGGGKMLGSSPAMGGDRPPMKRPRSRSPPKREGSLAVVVKNLPFTVQKREIFRHFNGVRFAKGDTSVTIEYHKDGRPNGTALIELATERDLQTALKMHRREELGGRLVDVISIPYKEYAERVETAIKYTPKDGGSPRKASPPPSSSSKDKLTRVKDEKPSMTSRGRSSLLPIR